MKLMLRGSLSFCQTAERIIFLDSRSGRYFALNERLEAAFCRWMAGVSQEADDVGHLAELQRLRILAPHNDQGAAVLASSPISSARSMRAFCWFDLPFTGIVLAISLRLLWKRRAKRWPFGRLLQELEDSMALPGVWSGTRRLAKILCAFDRADTILGSHDCCLERSLALLSACRMAGLEASLHFGVTSRPFGAHCWVEHGGTVLNDLEDRVKMFTPIMSL